MASLSQAKILGGIGAILIFIPFVSLIGYILIIVAVRDISSALQDKTIFKNVVIAAATGIVGAIAGALVVFAGALGSAFTAGLSAVTGVLTGLLIGWIFLIISAVFLRRAYNTIAQRLGINMFRTAATLYFVGAILTIVLVGFIVLFVAEILQAIAYFSIPDQPSMIGAGVYPGPTDAYAGPTGVATPPTMQTEMGATKFCISCGTKIAASATFCYKCGAKQP